MTRCPAKLFPVPPFPSSVCLWLTLLKETVIKVMSSKKKTSYFSLHAPYLSICPPLSKIIHSMHICLKLYHPALSKVGKCHQFVSNYTALLGHFWEFQWKTTTMTQKATCLKNIFGFLLATIIIIITIIQNTLLITYKLHVVSNCFTLYIFGVFLSAC